MNHHNYIHIVGDEIWINNEPISTLKEKTTPTRREELEVLLREANYNYQFYSPVVLAAQMKLKLTLPEPPLLDSSGNPVVGVRDLLNAKKAPQQEG